jgi:hypothetical protein
MAEVPHLMAEVPHLLSVPNGLADWDETKRGRSMSQGQTRNGSWMLARLNRRVGRSPSDEEAQSIGGLDWSCGSKEEVFKAMRLMSDWIAGLLAASSTGCVKLLCFIPMPFLALSLFRHANIGTNGRRRIHFPLTILLPCRADFPLILQLHLGKDWQREGC